ncbi:hypothetical protein KIPB_008929 [Kipferlia bialata]|uniref:Protein dpy-30 homolog n=1 Tax=Kipferlia bialata TaxID=797122 RepID=A0A9K3D370_9EUKA|nr:hypothetical protein KIPB_008929 [Kipferlia bialata]|eukprot:g8929.t1
MSEEGKENTEAPMTLQDKLKSAALPTRAYLDETVVPLLLQGLMQLVQVRPENPIEYLASYLLQHNPNKAAAPEPEQE